MRRWLVGITYRFESGGPLELARCLDIGVLQDKTFHLHDISDCKENFMDTYPSDNRRSLLRCTSVLRALNYGSWLSRRPFTHQLVTTCNHLRFLLWLLFSISLCFVQDVSGALVRTSTTSDCSKYILKSMEDYKITY